jgi:putative peptidoglycan lipid II flippase
MFNRSLDWALRWVVLLGAPAALGLVLLGGPTVATLFMHGQFSAADVRMTTLSLVAFAIGLPGFMLVKVLAPAFFARQDARTPVRAALVTAGASLVMSLILMRTMVHVGLALAVSLGALINAGLLYRSLRGDGVYRPLPGWGPFLLRVIGACAAMGALLGVGPPELATWMRWDASIRVLGLLGWVGGAALVFGATLLGLGLRPRALLRSPGS